MSHAGNIQVLKSHLESCRHFKSIINWTQRQ